MLVRLRCLVIPLQLRNVILDMYNGKHKKLREGSHEKENESNGSHSDYPAGGRAFSENVLGQK